MTAYRTFVALSLLLGISLTAEAQQVPAPRTPSAHRDSVQNKPADLAKITEQMRSNDNLMIERAISLAKAKLNDPKSAKAAVAEMSAWIKILSSQRRLDEIEELAFAGIRSNAEDLKFVEQCQEFRIRAKLIAGKPQEALVLAKGLYNVCAMPNTSHAIDLICECLYDANKAHDPAGAVKRFKLQQVQGAATPAATEPAAEKPVLAEVRVDPKPYKNAIDAAELSVDGYSGLCAKGNLLLLADQAKEARAVFEKAYTLASEQNLAAASESKARAMRAEDGVVGRANAWILSLRPEGQ